MYMQWGILKQILLNQNSKLVIYYTLLNSTKTQSLCTSTKKQIGGRSV